MRRETLTLPVPPYVLTLNLWGPILSRQERRQRVSRPPLIRQVTNLAAGAEPIRSLITPVFERPVAEVTRLPLTTGT